MLGALALGSGAFGAACGSEVNVFSNATVGAGGAGGDEASSNGGAVGEVGPGVGPAGPGSGGGDVGSGGGRDTSSGPDSTGSGTTICKDFGDPCTGCIAKQCADSWCGCAGDPECLALFDCYGKCNGDEACGQACLGAHPEGISDVLLVSGCAGTTCDASCNWGEPEFGTCEACVYSDCASETNACLSDPSCIALYQCLGDCEGIGLTCQKACYEKHGAGTAKLEAFVGCSSDKCKNAC